MTFKKNENGCSTVGLVLQFKVTGTYWAETFEPLSQMNGHGFMRMPSKLISMHSSALQNIYSYAVHPRKC